MPRPNRKPLKASTAAGWKLLPAQPTAPTDAGQKPETSQSSTEHPIRRVAIPLSTPQAPQAPAASAKVVGARGVSARRRRSRAAPKGHLLCVLTTSNPCHKLHQAPHCCAYTAEQTLATTLHTRPTLHQQTQQQTVLHACPAARAEQLSTAQRLRPHSRSCQT
jgi:hypothetical protein